MEYLDEILERLQAKDNKPNNKPNNQLDLIEEIERIKKKH